MFTLYRIEDIDRPTRGLYRVGVQHRAYAHMLSDDIDNTHLTPWEENHALRYDEFCAYADLGQYRAWWNTPEARAALFRTGEVRMRVYTVKDATVLTRQALFKFEDVVDVRDATPEEKL